MTQRTTVEFLEWIRELNPDALLADGFEDAIVGVAQQFTKDPLVVYDRAKCLEILQARDGMEYDEASEFFDFNVQGAWMGESTPLFLMKWEPCGD